MINKCVINVDWLTIYGVMPMPYDMLYKNECYKFEKAEYGNKFYKYVVNVKYKKQDICTIMHTPYSPILNKLGCNVRYNNRLLYCHDVWQHVKSVVEILQLSNVSITRFDICADFNLFANGMKPSDIIVNLASMKLRKIGKAKFAFYGVQTKDRNLYNGVRYGVHGSELSIYLYNKSLELKQQVYKPYIVQRWHENGLDVNNVWRLEISMNPKVKSYCDKVSGEMFLLNIDTLEHNLYRLYLSLVRVNWRIIPTDLKDTNVSRASVLPLCNWLAIPDSDLRPLRNVSCSSTYDKGVVNYLQRFDNTKLSENDYQTDLQQKEILLNASFVIKRRLGIN